ncbi:22906_t:CDS:1, partial [Gigaspora rosea]
KNPSKKLIKEEVPSRNFIKRQVLESSNKENGLSTPYTYRSNGSNSSNEARYLQSSTSSIKSGISTRRGSVSRGPSQERFNKRYLEESQADILKKILGRLMAIEEKYKINCPNHS